MGFAIDAPVTTDADLLKYAFEQQIANLLRAGNTYAELHKGAVNTLIAERVTIRQPSAVLLLIARQVDGTVRPLLDWRGAIAAGVAAGVVISLLRRGRR